VAYVDLRAAEDGRYGENPHRFQQFYQYQVLLKPRPRRGRAVLRFAAIGSAWIRASTTCASSRRLGVADARRPLARWQAVDDGTEISQFTYSSSARDRAASCRPS